MAGNRDDAEGIVEAAAREGRALGIGKPAAGEQTARRVVVGGRDLRREGTDVAAPGERRVATIGAVMVHAQAIADSGSERRVLAVLGHGRNVAVAAAELGGGAAPVA